MLISLFFYVMFTSTVETMERLHGTKQHADYTVRSLAEAPRRHRNAFTTQTAYNKGSSVPLLRITFSGRFYACYARASDCESCYTGAIRLTLLSCTDSAKKNCWGGFLDSSLMFLFGHSFVTCCSAAIFHSAEHPLSGSSS